MNRTERLKSNPNRLDFRQFHNRTKSENAEIRTFGFRTLTVSQKEHKLQTLQIMVWYSETSHEWNSKTHLNLPQTRGERGSRP